MPSLEDDRHPICAGRAMGEVRFWDSSTFIGLSHDLGRMRPRFGHV